MITAPSRFATALAYSHDSLTRATLDGVVIPLVSGTIRADRAQNIRRTGSCRLSADPRSTSTALANISTSSAIILEKGIRYLDGTIDYVTVGTMRVTDYKRLKNGYVDITYADHGHFVEGYPLIFPYAPVNVGTLTAMTVVAAIQYLVQEALSYTATWAIDLDAIPLAQLCPDGMLFTAGTGRWAAILQLAQLIGASVYPGPAGEWRIRQQRLGVPTVYDFRAGPGGVLIDASSGASRTGVFNGVGIEWGTPDVPGSVVLVTDDDPASPTKWGGPWGKVPKATQKVAVTSEAAAITAGRAILAQSRGSQGGLDMSAVYNPLLEPDDPVGVTQRTVARQVHLLDSFDLNLTGATMPAKTRLVTA